jgi:import inner membrane translocase subunit TIM44
MEKDEVKNSSENGSEETKQEEPKTDSDATPEAPQMPSKPLGIRLKEWGSLFVENVKLAYAEMTSDDKESLLERKLHTADSFRTPKPKKEDGEENEEEEEEVVKDAGPNAIVVVKEGKSPWEQMKERLQDSPFIRDILKRTKVVGQVAAQTDLGKQAQNIGTSVKDKVEDLRNFWETSQNPIVYTLSGVWDNMTGETEEAMTIAEIRKLDSKFIPEEWSEEVREKLAPLIIKAHLRGDTAALKPWLGEAVYNKLAADIRVRKTDGYVFDSNLLGIDENQMIMKLVEGGSPVIVVVYMVQQINCIKNRKGEIVEVSNACCNIVESVAHAFFSNRDRRPIFVLSSILWLFSNILTKK